MTPRWRKRVAQWRHAFRRAGSSSARRWPVTDLPSLLDLLGRRHVRRAHTTQTSLELDIDPSLAPDLTTSFPVLGDTLSALLERAIAVARGGRVALQVDIVRETPTSQTLHFTVGDDGTPAHPADTNFLMLSTRLAAIGGQLHVESGVDGGTRAIVELTLDMPRRWPRIDVDALRRALGGQEALREVITALDEALTRDLDRLEQLLAEPATGALQAWLHRVAGVLGMAEAVELAETGLSLERDLCAGRGAAIDDAVRAFGEDAARVLAVLREHLGDDGL